MPSAKLDTQIGIICMINDKSVTMVDCLGELIQYCIPPMEIDTNGNDRLEVWTHCLPYYRSAMKKLRQHQDFTDSDIESFQNDFDIFYQDWLKLHEKDGITNYVQLMSASHMADYMYEWCNL
eukprot:scaffold121323_cov32-Attheya_sp.AAC.2